MNRPSLLRTVLASGASWLGLLPGWGQEAAIPFESIVKIENSAVSFDYGSPWNAGNYGGGSGTGFYIGDNRFLTNAHVVSGSRRLMVTLPSDPTPRPAQLLFVAHDCDLAMFEMKDSKAVAGLKALEIGETPSLDDEVRVIGYPVGGERMSLTRGVVSRVDYVGYAHSQVDQHLAVQIDAAINPGNSGGPVLKENRVVGIAFQGLGQAENTGYMIPPPVIQRFLTDVEDETYDGYVELGLSQFPLLNPAQRTGLGLNGNGLGVLVTHVTATGSADGQIEKGDILLRIADHPIAADGTVEIDGERVNLAEVVERLFVGDRVQFQLLRGGEPREVELTLRTLPAFKILAAEYDHPPRYVVAAGLVFQPVNRNLLETIEVGGELSRALQEYLGEDGFLETPDLVIFTQVLPASVNSGAEAFVGGVVESIDGETIRTLQDVYRLLNERFKEDNSETETEAEAAPEASEFIEIQLRSGGRPVLLRRTEAAAAHQQILQQYGLRQDSRLGEETSFGRAEEESTESEAVQLSKGDKSAGPEVTQDREGEESVEPDPHSDFEIQIDEPLPDESTSEIDSPAAATETN